jgi:hypothetical protein
MTIVMVGFHHYSDLRFVRKGERQMPEVLTNIY